MRRERKTKSGRTFDSLLRYKDGLKILDWEQRQKEKLAVAPPAPEKPEPTEQLYIPGTAPGTKKKVARAPKSDRWKPRD